MTTDKARKIKEQLLALCKVHGLWVEVKEANKPELKDIVLTISIKVIDK